MALSTSWPAPASPPPPATAPLERDAGERSREEERGVLVRALSKRSDCLDSCEGAGATADGAAAEGSRPSKARARSGDARAEDRAEERPDDERLQRRGDVETGEGVPNTGCWPRRAWGVTEHEERVEEARLLPRGERRTWWPSSASSIFRAVTRVNRSRSPPSSLSTKRSATVETCSARSCGPTSDSTASLRPASARSQSRKAAASGGQPAPAIRFACGNPAIRFSPIERETPRRRVVVTQTPSNSINSTPR